MSKLITSGNLAIFEYPIGANNPSFTLEKDGVLWIEGYSIPFTPSGKPIRAMKRFDLKLKNYTVIGKYDYAKSRIEGDFSKVIEGVNTDNCVVMVMSNTIPAL